MENQGLSITLQDNNISNTGVITNSQVNSKIPKSIALLAVMLSVYAASGSPATTVMPEFKKIENMVSVTDSTNIEKKVKEQDYSFISAMGFEDDSASFPEMFI